MRKAIAGFALGTAVMGLTACNDGKENTTPTISKAEGEILPRSVTDEMLPYDSLRSQPPLADPEDEKSPGRRVNRAEDVSEAPSSEPAQPPATEASAPAESQPQPAPQLRPDAE
ncbi:MAG: hypothetical protein P8J20_19370 [Novosphingobium sp.]|nr:hypothetical protein [Novosphingobium sp.]